MLVSEFMIPSSKVVTVTSKQPLQRALDHMVENKVGCVVVLDSAKSTTSPESAQEHPVGIVSKGDFLRAYTSGFTLDASVSEIMTKHPQVVRHDITRDEAAKFFELKQIHHAIAVNDFGTFVGLISTWDIAVECAKDGRAWPYIRSADGRFHHPQGKDLQLQENGPSSPRSPAEQQNQGRRPRSNSHAFLDYIDSIRDLTYTIDST
mmetsp:Transcript_17053/g.28398  ORF Transcript_17053/g.28398 Transcript_17053/m.28398 type:complete len:206 (-) Transcript_17053:651-1268(-)